MKKEEAIKFLQQLYPNGGHCWLDEQRIEAIGMAVKALQEEPVTDDLLVAADKAWLESEDKESYAETFIDGFVACFNWQKRKDSISSKDLEELINTLSKRYPEVSFAKLSRIAVRVAKWQTLYDMGITERKAQNTVQDILKNGDKLEAFATEIAFKMFPANLQEPYHDMHRGRIVDAVMYGAEWQKENLWKPADGDDLPEIDREVVVFTQNFPNDAGIMSVSIAHRPNPNGWDGKSLSTGKVEHYTPKTYDKGGWNIPNVAFWLDLDIPKL